jgi:hypothetical protein
MVNEFRMGQKKMHAKYTRIDEVHRRKRMTTFSHRLDGFRFRLQILTADTTQRRLEHSTRIGRILQGSSLSASWPIRQDQTASSFRMSIRRAHLARSLDCVGCSHLTLDEGKPTARAVCK